VTLLLSDVLGNDPRVIASGPTIPGDPSARHALSLLHDYQVIDDVPSAVVAVLEDLAADLQPPFEQIDQDLVYVIADNEMAVKAALTQAQAKAITAQIIWTSKTGEAADLGRAWVQECISADQSVDVLLGGGEATVTVLGDGKGGRNTEFAAAACAELERLAIDDWTIGSLATDGQDGTTEFAGAFGDRSTWRRALDNDVDPERALANNDTASIFAAPGVGGAVLAGPTGTNVNDLYFAVRSR
jgi:hydroxypyruvate reductase